MANSQRRTGAALGALIFESGDQFELHQLVRLLHRLNSDCVPIGYFGPPGKEAVRLYGVHDLISPNGSVKAVSAAPPYKRQEESSIPAHVLTPSGLADGYNPCSLPTIYIEQIRRALQIDRNPVLAEFIDLFNHRLLSLEHRAWERPRFYIRYEQTPEAQRSRQTLSAWLYSLMGSGFEALAERLQIPDRALLRYSSFFLPPARPGANLRNMVGDFSGVGAEVIEFRGRWCSVAHHDRASLQPSLRAPLGLGPILGASTWYQQASIRIRLGPVSFADFKSFLPGTRNFANIVELANHYTRRAFDEVEVELVIAEKDLPGCELGRGHERPRLGWVSWLLKPSHPRETRLRSAVFRSTDLMAVLRHSLQDALARTRKSLEINNRLQLGWGENAVQALMASCGRIADRARVSAAVFQKVEKPILELLQHRDQRPKRVNMQVNEGQLSFQME